MMDATLDDPQRSRMVVWQALGDGPDDARALSDEWRATLTDAVERMRSRQESGEVTDEFDPEFAVLLGFVLSFAPIALPQVVEGIYGIDPLSAEYRERVRAQLMKILVPRARVLVMARRRARRESGDRVHGLRRSRRVNAAFDTHGDEEALGTGSSRTPRAG